MATTHHRCQLHLPILCGVSRIRKAGAAHQQMLVFCAAAFGPRTAQHTPVRKTFACLGSTCTGQYSIVTSDGLEHMKAALNRQHKRQIIKCTISMQMATTPMEMETCRTSSGKDGWHQMLRSADLPGICTYSLIVGAGAEPVARPLLGHRSNFLATGFSCSKPESSLEATYPCKMHG